jgi:hypothetical protein
MATFDFALDPGALKTLRLVAVDFFVLFAVFSFVSAILLQAAHESLRSYYNHFVLQRWLKLRTSKILSIEEFCAEVGGSGSGLLSLPYWQLTGQINAAVSSQLNLYPGSRLVELFADIRGDYEERIISQLTTRGVTVENQKAAILRDVAARAQAGINSLHADLRIAWAMFDYSLSLIINMILVAGMTTVVATQGQRPVLYTIGLFFSWLATPIVRRVIEILVPFR